MKPTNLTLAREQGAALVTVLLLLVIVTILGLASIRNTLLEQRMSAASVDRARALQASEAGLRRAEAKAMTDKPAPAIGSGCAGGVCARATLGSAPPWAASGFWDDGKAGYGTFAAVDGVVPKYVIEYMGDSAGSASDCTTKGDLGSDNTACSNTTKRYRVTVTSTAPSGGEVQLQSMYLVPGS